MRNAWLYALRAISVGLLMLAASGPARAQPDFGNSFSPELGHVPIRGDYRAAWFPVERVQEQGTKLGYVQQDLSVGFPILQNENDEWAGSFKIRNETFDTNAFLPTSMQPFPDDLWNIHLGTTYRHLFENGWIAGGSLTVGSASDQPFHGINELTLGAAATLRIPQGEHNAWLFSLNYSTNREFLNYIPIPGVAYLWVPNNWFQATIGLPFLSVTIRPIENLTLTASYAPLTEVHSRITYRILPPLKVYVGFDWGHESFYLADRQDERDRFFYYDKRVTAGIGWAFTDWLMADLSGGYTFDRFYFQGHNFSDRSTDRLDIGDGAFVALRVDVRF